MKQIILSLIWVTVAAMATLNAQQASPSQATATQQTSKPRSTGTRPFPQPKVQPTQTTTANNNPGREKGMPNDPSHRKPAVNIPGNGNKIDTNVGRGKTT